MKPNRLAWLLVLLVFSSGVARGQGVGSSGDIRGVITDPAGRVIPKAAIVAEAAEKGMHRTSTSDENGQYEFTGLPPGTYR